MAKYQSYRAVADVHEWLGTQPAGSSVATLAEYGIIRIWQRLRKGCPSGVALGLDVQ